MNKLLFFPIFAAALLLSACSNASPSPTSQVDGGNYLTPYHTATLTPTISPTPLDQPTQTPKPTITPTPRIYEVRAGDQLLGIAYAFGITLEDLQAANPDVNPSLMSIGTRLVIPPPRGITPTVAAPTPTPFDVTLDNVECLPAATGGLHCFALVHNERKNPATNLSGEFKLINASGAIEVTRVVALPLNRLEPGAKLPFYTYFDPALVNGNTVEFSLLTATKLNADDSGVFPLVVVIDTSEIAGNARSATISGSVLSEIESDQVTFVAVAYDASGNIVGMRRIEEQIVLTAGTPHPFTLQVFSIGGDIITIEVYAEAEIDTP